MYAMARMLKPKDIENVSHYVASLKPKKQERTLQGDPVAGEKIYQTCAACHGAKGLGNKVLNSPPLIHSQDWYLYSSVMNYRNGRRAADSQRSQGYAMVPISKSLPNEKAIADVVAYIQTLKQ